MSFSRVSKSHPCPICQKPDWCRVFTDGWVECMRLESDRSAKSGGWMHWRGQLPIGLRPARPPRFSAPPSINATKMIREWQATTSQAALEDFARELGLSAVVLKSVGAAWAASHQAWAFPMCDGYGNVVGIRLRNQHGKFAVRGSRQGIFGSTATAKPWLYVCEGPTDAAAAVQLGLFAVGRPNCCCGGSEIRIFARRHDCQRVVIVSDNDKPGLDGARKVGGELRLRFAVYVPPAKDLREFVRLGGTREMIENTLKNTVWHL